MDSLCELPIYSSSLEADELDDVSGDEPGDADEASEDDSDPADVANCSLRDEFVQPRFDRWLRETATGDQARSDLLHEMFGRLSVTARNVEAVSSERRMLLDFELFGMLGQYRQTSQADASSPVWDVSEGKFELKANVEAELVLDSETLVTCAHFVQDPLGASAREDEGGSASSGRSRRWINRERLSDRFGSDTLATLGGPQSLLQFLGVICADAGVPCYAEALPFGLSAQILAASEDPEDRQRRHKPKPPASPASSRSPARSRGAAPAKRSSAKPPPSRAAPVKANASAPTPSVANAAPVPALAPDAGAAYPAAAASAGPSLEAAPPLAPPAPPATPQSGPSRPRTGSQGASRSSPKAGAAAKGSAAAPKARQSSHSRRASSGSQRT